MTGLVLRAGTTAHGPYELEVTPESAGGYSVLRVVHLAPAEEHRFGTGADEVAVMPLKRLGKAWADQEVDPRITTTKAEGL